MPYFYQFHRAFPTLLLTIFFIALSGCTSLQTESEQIIIVQTPEQRTKQLKQLTHWKVTGKIAFIEKSSRSSASLSWAVNEPKKTQELNLTTYMGINVLQLNSRNNEHTIKVDGETYQGNNLEQLIFNITGLTLPTNALTYWLKGLPFDANDTLHYETSATLPTSLSSKYNNDNWQVSYGKYQQFDSYLLATKFTIQKNDLIIKIAINNWNIVN